MTKPMKVLHLTTHLNIGGITTYIRLLTKEMVKLSYKFYVASSGGTQEAELEGQGAQLLKLNIRTKSELSPKLYFAIPKLIAFLRKEKIDLIHAHTRVTQVLAWWIRFFTGIPYVSTCHGFYKQRLGRKLLPAWGNRVIAISVPVGESLTRDFGITSNQIVTIFNSVDIEDLEERYRKKNPLEIRRKFNVPEKSPVIGIIARVVEDKGHEFFLRAALTLISKQLKNLKIIIVGDGPFLPRVREMAREFNLETSTVFMGNVQDVTEALAMIDIFVLPAIWREGFGLSIIEAMTLKKPVIVTNIWALNELVQDRVNGLLINPKDPNALANAIQELAQDHELYERIALNGYEMVHREFSIEKMAQKIDELYRNVVSENGKKYRRQESYMC